MAAGMERLTKKELIELMDDIPEDEYIGYLFTARSDMKSPEHQVLVFFNPLKSI